MKLKRVNGELDGVSLIKNDMLGLGLEIGNLKFKNIDTYDFSSDVTLFDYDIIIINLNSIKREYAIEKDFAKGQHRRFRGNLLIDKDDSFRLSTDLARRKKQISDSLELGKTIVIIPPVENDYAIYTGDKEFSGTGRNRSTTNILNVIDILEVLPIKVQVESKNVGEKIQYIENTSFTPLFERSDIHYYYDSFLEIEGDCVVPLAYAQNTEKIISANMQVSKGNMLFIPPLLNRDIYNQLNDTKYRIVFNKFLHILDEIHGNLKKTIENYELPYWTNKYSIFNEFEIIENINTIDNRINILIEDKRNKRKQLEQIQRYKLLLTSSGEQLEKIVHQVLIELGFEKQISEHNRADGIFTFNSSPLVVEIKGVSKSAAERHVAQLEKWVSEYFVTTNKQPKGILIANTFNNKDLSERKELDFPKQMLPYAEQRGHCLLTTTQLLCLYIEIKLNPNKKTILINELLKNVGVYKKFKDYSDYIIQ